MSGTGVQIGVGTRVMYGAVHEVTEWLPTVNGTDVVLRGPNSVCRMSMVELVSGTRVRLLTDSAGPESTDEMVPAAVVCRACRKRDSKRFGRGPYMFARSSPGTGRGTARSLRHASLASRHALPTNGSGVSAATGRHHASCSLHPPAMATPHGAGASRLIRPDEKGPIRSGRVRWHFGCGEHCLDVMHTSFHRPAPARMQVGLRPAAQHHRHPGDAPGVQRWLGRAVQQPFLGGPGRWGLRLDLQQLHAVWSAAGDGVVRQLRAGRLLVSVVSWPTFSRSGLGSTSRCLGHEARTYIALPEATMKKAAPSARAESTVSGDPMGSPSRDSLVRIHI